MSLICGIEEAGRGPVIGPMVMAGITIKEKDIHKLDHIKESKLLTPTKRERLFDEIIKIAESYEIVILSAKEIDNALNSESLNLNWLEAETTSKIINKLQPDKII